ncbi:hypothetical protein FK178_06575 [Antarcticibacterium arcticum]|uniref:Riboflavin synthase subunit beta n=1 Tax=Antarcticibacterium arcticum TaxID=2585771 RepID=A0A5B8YHU5_9FLAO|nr:hypothetical protein [Antarcticibacterium arcticum]QED37404.1 hypothetical protein FK178_06575 [Antarcticibacterium arcticum]
MKANFLKLRKNSRYNYTPRYYKGKDSGNLYEFDSKFNKYRNTTNAIDFGSQWADARNSSRNRGNRELNKRVIIIILILVLIVLWILDFDLSIFSN